MVHNVIAPSLILPLVFKLIRPNSVLDVGCGIGTWLSVSKNLGVRNILGIDGEYVDRNLLDKHLEDSEFIVRDLTIPFDLEKKFDLILCLEVAEHLPEKSSENLVSSLVNHSDFILFSAALPGQGGQNHLNEQWPNYWSEKFESHGYSFLDAIRPLIWDNPSIDFWYKQNIFLVAKREFQTEFISYKDQLSRIHPGLIDSKNFQIKKLEQRLEDFLNSEQSLKFYLSLLKKKIYKILF